MTSIRMNMKLKDLYRLTEGPNDAVDFKKLPPEAQQAAEDVFADTREAESSGDMPRGYAAKVESAVKSDRYMATTAGGYVGNKHAFWLEDDRWKTSPVSELSPQEKKLVGI